MVDITIAIKDVITNAYNIGGNDSFTRRGISISWDTPFGKEGYSTSAQTPMIVTAKL